MTTTTTSPALDRNGLEILDEAECWRLLSASTIGRIGITSGALPLILPVNFVVVDGAILILTGEGSKLAAATRNAVVAFEVDDFDPLYHSGWSVALTGVARQLVDDDAIARARTTRLAHWVPDTADHFIRIEPGVLSGRRIVRIAS